MMKKRDRELALAWIREQTDVTAGRLLAVLNGNGTEQFADVPRQLVRMIHNMALFSVLKVVNFPEGTVIDESENDHKFECYDAFANRHGRKMVEFCDALARWRPENAQDTTTGKAKIRRRRKQKKTTQPPQTESGSQGGQGAPQTTEEQADAVEIPGLTL